MLASESSATVALEKWCAARGIADPAHIRAVPVADGAVAPSSEALSVLGIGSDEPIGYRHVRLMCGETVMSDAHNWYIPARLTPDMNRALATTDVPFGRVVAPLGFRREPLATGHGPSSLCPAGTVLSHSALLRLPDGRPFSVVSECYTEALLAGQ